MCIRDRFIAAQKRPITGSSTKKQSIMEALGQVCSVPNIRVSDLFFECIGRALRISVMLLSNLEHLKTLLVLRFLKKVVSASPIRI